MVIDFSQVLKTLRGEPLRQFIFETAVLDLARQRGEVPGTVWEAAAVLDAAGVKIRDVLDHLGEEFTLRDACVIALDTRSPEDRSPKSVAEKHHLAHRIYGAKESIRITGPESNSIQQALLLTQFSGLIIGQAIDMLDAGSSDPKEPAATVPAGKPEK